MNEYIDTIQQFLGTPLGTYTAIGTVAVVSYFLGRGRREVIKAKRDVRVAEETTDQGKLDLKKLEETNKPAIVKLENEEAARAYERQKKLAEQNQEYERERIQERDTLKKQRLETRRKYASELIGELKKLEDDPQLSQSVRAYVDRLRGYSNPEGEDNEAGDYRKELEAKLRATAEGAGLFGMSMPIGDDQLGTIDDLVEARFRGKKKKLPKPPKPVRRYMKAVVKLAELVEEFSE